MKTSVAAALAACVLAAGEARAAFPIIAYTMGGNPTAAQWRQLTHLNIAFVQTSGSGEISGVNATKFKQFAASAHAEGAKVGLAVGGWNGGNTSGFDNMARSADTRTTFVRNALRVLEENGLDGIDIDWEYPTASTAANFEALMKELWETLHPKGKYVSIAVISKGAYYGQHIRAPVFNYIDFLNIMSYDAGGSHHSTYEEAVASMDYWAGQRKCPKEKTILGLPFYGRSGGGSRSYADIVASDPANAQKDVAGGYGYNGIPTIQRKTQLAYDRGGGVMFWQLTQDAQNQYSLLTAIRSKAATFATGVIAARAMRPGAFSATSGAIRLLAPAGRYVFTLHAADGSLALRKNLEVTAGHASLARDAALGAGTYLARLSGPGPAFSQTLALP